MENWKFLLGSIFMFCTFLSCQPTNIGKGREFELCYDKNNMLLIENLSDASTIKRIELDKQQDTLVICKIIKKQGPFYGEHNARKTASCIIKFPENIEFVKLGDKLYKLSELREFSQDELLRSRISIIIVPSYKFPCVIE